jgi:hypothetical protein
MSDDQAAGRGAGSVWEPVTFAVGDRVQVLPRPECFYCRGAEDEDGLIGVVEHVGFRNYRFRSELTEPGEQAHIYWVGFPDEIPSQGTHHSHFAACELERAPDAAGTTTTDGEG